jgi:hypothetical protein
LMAQNAFPRGIRRACDIQMPAKAASFDAWAGARDREHCF